MTVIARYRALGAGPSFAVFAKGGILTRNRTSRYVQRSGIPTLSQTARKDGWWPTQTGFRLALLSVGLGEPTSE